MTSHDASTSYSSSSRGHTADAHEQTARWIRELAAIERPSASPGERDAAQWIVRRLARAGFHARVEAERAHGTHLPFVLPSVATLLAGLLRSRRLAATVALAAVWLGGDDARGDARLPREAPRRVRPRPPHYHRPSDVPENVNVDSVLGARRLCVAMIDELEPAAESRDSRPAY